MPFFVPRVSYAIQVYPALPAGDGADDQVGLGPAGDGVWEGGVGGLVGEVFLAGVEPQEGAAAVRDVVADRAAEDGVAGLQGVEHRALGRRAVDPEPHL